MHKIFVMYKLKSGVSLDQYKAWLNEIDQPITPCQPGMIRFEVSHRGGFAAWSAAADATHRVVSG